MLPDVVMKMIKRVLASTGKTSKMVVKSLGQTSVQLVLGAILIVYTAFLESEKERLLSILMTNPIGRVAILAFLALLAVASPPVAILFAVLVVMSYTKESLEYSTMSVDKSKPADHEGFWSGDSKDDTKDDEDDKPNTTTDHSELLSQLTSAMKSMSPSKEEGFESMYAPDASGETESKDASKDDVSLMQLGGLVGHVPSETQHSSA